MAQDGDFKDHVLSRRRSLLRSAWFLTGDWDTAEDLVQSALMKCYPKWAGLDAGSADAYVRRAVVNAHSSSWRRRWRGEIPTYNLPDRPAPGDAYDAADLREATMAALRRLTPRQRATVVLRYFEDLSEADTAAALGCSVGTVKSQTARAFATLRQLGISLREDGRDA